MALSAGTRLGPYEILAPLGAGGMGEVYRARDTRLDRTVAVKVLPSDLAADAHLKARFEREARAISALAHPNICTLYDVGEEDGQTFLVMEHLVGQTLADRLKKGPLPLEQALEVGTQVADALAAAHKQGIVHRDLKPGNVMLTKTGARLLDFGLARLTAHGEQPAVGSLTSAPTEQEPLTGAGTVIQVRKVEIFRFTAQRKKRHARVSTKLCTASNAMQRHTTEAHMPGTALCVGLATLQKQYRTSKGKAP